MRQTLQKRTALWLLAVLMLCLLPATALAANPAKIQKERTEIEALSAKALENLYAKVPSSRAVIRDC